jgi:N-methylhydantoinase B
MNIDPIDRDTFQHEIVSAAEEMSVALRRSAYSSIIWDMYDYACGLLLPSGEMLAQAETIPAQLGIMRLAAQHMLQAIPLASWRAGDVLIANDPYRGCTHTPDIVLFSPIFYKGEVIAIASTIAHHIDIGGKVPGTEAADSREIFEEGLILPPLKLVEAGRPNRAIFDIIAANVRDPKASAGDLRAQIAGCHTGERRVQALAQRYGAPRFKALSGAVMDYAETYVRRSLSAIGQGHGKAVVLIEDGFGAAEPLAIHVQAMIQGDRLILDFTGTSAQRDCGLNCPAASTHSMVHFAVKALFAPTLPQNEGCNRPIEIRLPEGTVLSPRRPAAVSVRHLTQQALADAVLKALTPLVPDTSAAGCHVSFPTFTAGGFDDRPGTGGGEPSYFLISDIIGGGMGGYPGGDGIAAVDTHGGNCALLSAEVLETMSPIRVRRSVLVPGSGGAGEFRGGLAMERDYEMLASVCTVSGYYQQGAAETAPWGWAGGGPGGLAGGWLYPAGGEARELASKHIALRLRRGDVLRYRSAGGGGWGDPAHREPEAKAADSAAGFVASPPQPC